MAVWFGIVTGFGEVAILAYRKFYQHRIIYFGPQVAWMAPVADVCIFAIPGLVLFLLAWRWPKLVSLSRAVFLFALLGFLSGLLMFGSVAWYASVVLSAGLAVQAARVIRVYSSGFQRTVRRMTPWLVVGVMSLAIGIQGYQRVHERLALAALPPSDPKAPNVLLIVMDTVRAQELSLYGYSRPTTPNLERLAKTGVVFDRAISTAPWTLPSHASMFTGRFPHELSVGWWNPLDNKYPTLAEVLSSQGYLTAGFVGNLWYCNSELGLNRGFLHYEDYVFSVGALIRSSELARTIAGKEAFQRATGYYDELGRKTAAEVNQSFLSWISQANGRPFFVFVNYYDAHHPYLPPDPFATKFGAKAPWRNPSKVEASRKSKVTFSSQETQAEVRAYDESITYLDYEMGLLFDALKKRGLLENTLLIITSDHGEQIGEHDLFLHSTNLYRQLLNVPLVISFPSRVPEGKRVQSPISLRDIAATVMNLIQVGNKFGLPGRSLEPYWNGTSRSDDGRATPLLSEVSKGPPNTPSWMPNAKGNMESLVSDGLHYIKNGDNREELYDFENDPSEDRNLAEFEASSASLMKFRLSLKRLMVREPRDNHAG